VIGAASMASSISHTIRLLLPVLVAVLISVAICRLLSDSVFDIVIKQRELPLMPTFDLYASYYQSAADVMRTDYEVVNFTDTFGDIALKLSKSHQTMFPLVDENYVFLGAIRRSNMERVLTDNKMLDPSNPTLAELLKPEGVLENLSTAELSLTEDIFSEEKPVSPKQRKADPDHIELNILNQRDEDPDTKGKEDSQEISAAALLRAMGTETQEATIPAHIKLDIQDPLVKPTDPVPFVFLSRHTGSSSANIVEVDSTVMQIDSNTSIFKAHFLFTMLGLGSLFVTSRGKLCGVITRTSLIKSISGLNSSSNITNKTLPVSDKV